MEREKLELAFKTLSANASLGHRSSLCLGNPRKVAGALPIATETTGVKFNCLDFAHMRNPKYAMQKTFCRDEARC